MDDVVAEESHREHAPAARSVNTTRGVQGQHMEAHGIAGLELPAQDRKLVAPGFDIRQVGETALGEPFRLGVHE
jgi:hypothetical protein